MEETAKGFAGDSVNLRVIGAFPPCYCSESVPMIRLTPEGVIDCINDCFCRIGHFMAKDKLLGRFVGEFMVYPEDSEWVREGLRCLADRESDVVRRECEVYSDQRIFPVDGRRSLAI